MVDCFDKFITYFPNFDYDEGGKILDSKLIFDFTKGIST